jgi:HJR/Mrr/RecB family endonuclease
MSIQNAARAYLKDAPADWHKFAHILATRVARHIAADAWQSAHSSSEIASIGTSVAELVLATLLSPANVQVIAGTESESPAYERITECISEALDGIKVEVPDDPDQEYLDDIVDLGTYGPVRRWDGYGDAYRDAPELLSVYSISRIANLQAEQIFSIVQTIGTRASWKPSEAQDQVTSKSLVRLDLIDLALYRTLIKHPELMQTLDWRVFEKLLADIIETFGYTVELQRGTKDGGVDIFAIRSDQFGQHRYMIQAKRWSNRVGVEPVRQLLFLHGHHHATKSCLATTSAFTDGAWDLAAQYRWQLELRDFEGIRDWLGKAHELKGGG